MKFETITKRTDRGSVVGLHLLHFHGPEFAVHEELDSAVCRMEGHRHRVPLVVVDCQVLLDDGAPRLAFRHAIAAIQRVVDEPHLVGRAAQVQAIVTLHTVSAYMYVHVQDRRVDCMTDVPQQESALSI